MTSTYITRYSLHQILQASAEAVGITVEEATNRERSLSTNICRGIYYLIAEKNRHSARTTAEYIGRKRPTAILVANRFRGYIDCDKEIKRIYEKTKEILSRA